MIGTISVFEIFKIGIGPSSSHAMGPWNAARDYLEKFINEGHNHDTISHINIELFGSLAKTGRGHGTDKALIMGLTGAEIETTNTHQFQETVNDVISNKRLRLLGQKEIQFNAEKDIIFNTTDIRTTHPNTIDFTLTLDNDSTYTATYYSLGGGFIKRKGIKQNVINISAIPYPIQTAAEMLEWCLTENKTIAEISFTNECCWKSSDQIHIQLKNIWSVMLESAYEGCHTSGELPGGLHVGRRASRLNSELLKGQQYSSQHEWMMLLKKQPRDMNTVTNWVSCLAMAVNEVNAAYGRIVTAPTNGAAGVIPAVLIYLICFNEDIDDSIFYDFLLVAGEIGMLFKKGATISAAAGGCQAEIGVSSAMAAGALTFTLGGNIHQVLMAAEIAMEHHLGLSCDPIGGLVQIPCIERNTMGAMKAITAAQLAMHTNPEDAKVSLDDVIKTMWETAKDMMNKYKETAEGGLALQISINHPEC